MSNTLEFTRQIKAPPEHVYYSLTHEHSLREWLSDGSWAQQRQGGRFFLNWNTGGTVTGQFTALEENKAMTLAWYGSDDPGPTQVRITLKAEGGGTQVTLAHDGFGAGDGWAQAVERAREMWEAGLENLQSVVETGWDLRVTRRPMLGVYPAQFDAERAAKLGVPVAEGILLENVIEEMGAEAAGLTKDDVIVGLGGQPVRDYNTLVASVTGRHAGDTVEVEFYRGAEKRRVQMTLSGRQLPDVPPTAQGLADAIQRQFDEIRTEMDAVLEGVSEEIASHRPAEDEWSVKEILAHLILGERDEQFYIASLLSDDAAANEVRNLPSRIKALTALYPTLADLRAELRRAEGETVAFLAELPAEFVARKASYVYLGWGLLEGFDIHPRLHLDQMRQAIAAAVTA